MSADLESLQLAFAYHVVCEVIGADATIDPAELAWIHAMFPFDRLLERGLVDRHGKVTPLLDELRHQALIELPERLSADQKLSLVRIVAHASAADGVLAPEEADTIAAVARMLGVPDRLWLSMIDDLLRSGMITRDATASPVERLETR